MTRSGVHDRLLAWAPRLAAATNVADIVAELCRDARELTGAPVALCAFAAPPKPWEQGLHVAFVDDVLPVTAAVRSAMFGIHRRMIARREATTLEPSEEHRAIFDALLSPRAVYAAPLVHRTGRIVGEIVLLAPERGLDDLHHLLALAVVAFENALRLAAARHDQDRLLLVAEATDEALWDWNIDTGELWWGGGIQNILGSGAEQAHPRLDWKMSRIHPDDRARVEASFAGCRASVRSQWQEDYRFRRTDGTWAHVEDRGHFMREPTGRAYRVFGSLRDVSALHASHVALREAHLRAVEANRAKDEFLAMLGHELRNPLSPMSTALQLMRLRGAESREQQVLERQVAHLTRLVDDLLDVSRIARGKIELRKERLDLASVVTRALEVVSPLLEQKRHVVHVDVARGIAVEADAARMTQVLVNVLTNAAKYSEANTAIRVTATDEGDVARLDVEDEGFGIEPDMVEHVFDMFVQQPQTIDRSGGGLGLGLAIVRNLVELHGGRVSVKSEGGGKGSTFTIELPIAACASSSVPDPTTALAEATHKKRILVVDDNVDGAEMMRELLEGLGHRVKIAHDGLTALEIAEELRPTVALLDIGLPVMDGYELATRLRERLQGTHLRLIAVTGYGQEEDRRRAAEAGFDDHLVKPIDLKLLTKKLEEDTPASRRNPVAAIG